MGASPTHLNLAELLSISALASVPFPTGLLALGVTRLLKIIANLRGIKLFYIVPICIITRGSRLR